MKENVKKDGKNTKPTCIEPPDPPAAGVREIQNGLVTAWIEKRKLKGLPNCCLVHFRWYTKEDTCNPFDMRMEYYIPEKEANFIVAAINSYKG